MSNDKIKGERRFDAESATVERRAVARHPCVLRVTCQQINGQVVEPWTVAVRDISETGIALVFDRTMEPGTLLVLEVPFPNENEPRSLGMQVIHSTPRVESGFAIGCQFDQRLKPLDVLAILDVNLLEV
jgi:hypothetical protein